jgi:HSP20 family protein
LDLPGVRTVDINVELRDNDELRITGQYPERERKGMLRRQTRRSGHFEYDVVLPGAVDPEKIDATLENGVLTVRLAKSASAMARQIAVKGHQPNGKARGSGTSGKG